MLFSSHFGEPPPNCKNRCDICRNKKEVEERANNFLMRCIQFSETSDNVEMDYSDLYGGGRKGQKMYDLIFLSLLILMLPIFF